MRKIWQIALIGMAVALFCVPNGTSAQTEAPRYSTGQSVWSFEMWCIDMEMYSMERCTERRSEDLNAYQAYVARTERYQQEISEQERRQEEARQRLDRATGNPGALPP